MVLRRPATNREEAIAPSVAAWQRIGSPGYPFDVDLVGELIGEAYDRPSTRPAGPDSSRQFSVRPIAPRRFTNVDVPTLVLHGEADPLITISGGAATAAAIPGRGVTFPGMGHDLPRPCGRGSSTRSPRWSRMVKSDRETR